MTSKKASAPGGSTTASGSDTSTGESPSGTTTADSSSWAVEGAAASASGASGASLEIKSLQMAKAQQEDEGKATLQLIESAGVPKASAEPGKGSVIDTYA